MGYERRSSASRETSWLRTHNRCWRRLLFRRVSHLSRWRFRRLLRLWRSCCRSIITLSMSWRTLCSVVGALCTRIHLCWMESSGGSRSTRGVMGSRRASTCRCSWRCPRLNGVKKSTNTRYSCWTSNFPGRTSAGNTVQRSTSASAGGTTSSFYCKNWRTTGTWKRMG